MALRVVPALRAIERHPAFLAMGQHPMFAALARDELQCLLRAGRVEQLAAGQVLYSRGDASTRFFPSSRARSTSPCTRAMAARRSSTSRGRGRSSPRPWRSWRGPSIR